MRTTKDEVAALELLAQTDIQRDVTVVDVPVQLLVLVGSVLDHKSEGNRHTHSKGESCGPSCGKEAKATNPWCESIDEMVADDRAGCKRGNSLRERGSMNCCTNCCRTTLKPGMWSNTT
jgi:hypothetical protein